MSRGRLWRRESAFQRRHELTFASFAGGAAPVSPLALRSDHDQSFPQRFDAARVENGLVTIQSTRLTPIGNFVIAILLGALLWVAVPVVIGRPLRFWEAGFATAAILALFEWWRRRRLRRDREQIESVRDSALW
jgi:Flp pilus assembly protein TadB